MACGCPVIVSNRGALPEIAGGAAFIVDPTDQPALAARIGELLTDAGARRELRERGLERASRFSWARAARQTLEVYDRL